MSLGLSALLDDMVTADTSLCTEVLNSHSPGNVGIFTACVTTHALDGNGAAPMESVASSPGWPAPAAPAPVTPNADWSADASWYPANLQPAPLLRDELDDLLSEIANDTSCPFLCQLSLPTLLTASPLARPHGSLHGSSCQPPASLPSTAAPQTHSLCVLPCEASSSATTGRVADHLAATGTGSGARMGEAPPHAPHEADQVGFTPAGRAAGGNGLAPIAQQHVRPASQRQTASSGSAVSAQQSDNGTAISEVVVASRCFTAPPAGGPAARILGHGDCGAARWDGAAVFLGGDSPLRTPPAALAQPVHTQQVLTAAAVAASVSEQRAATWTGIYSPAGLEGFTFGGSSECGRLWSSVPEQGSERGPGVSRAGGRSTEDGQAQWFSRSIQRLREMVGGKDRPARRRLQPPRGDGGPESGRQLSGGPPAAHACLAGDGDDSRRDQCYFRGVPSVLSASVEHAVSGRATGGAVKQQVRQLALCLRRLSQPGDRITHRKKAPQ